MDRIRRKPFQGVINILCFNRHFYIIGLSLISIIIISQFLIEWSLILYFIIIFLFLYGLIMPLIISAHVYDYSLYYNFNWLKQYQIQDSKATQIVSLNAGFDETSFDIKYMFPKSNLKVFDFYNVEKHTEPAIVRARKVSQVYPNTQSISSNFIPLEDNCVDVILILSAAHEIRSNKEKIEFLKECNRICKLDGKLIMVEHLRDVPNFFAFTFGFTHFFSKKVWIAVLKKAGFVSISETKFTPFLSIFYCNP